MIHCDHNGFYSQRSCRKHLRNHHDWFYCFDKKPEINDLPSKIEAVVQKNVQPSRSTRNIPNLQEDTIFAQAFFEWLTSIAGGGLSKSRPDQIVFRICKFLCVSNEDLIHDNIKDSDIAFSAGSTENIGRFMETMETEWKLGNSGQRLFKTADRYVFDSIILDNTCIVILDGYVKYI